MNSNPTLESDLRAARDYIVELEAEVKFLAGADALTSLEQQLAEVTEELRNSHVAFNNLHKGLAGLREVLEQARKVADTAGTFTPWACGEASARRQVGKLKQAIKEFDNG